MLEEAVATLKSGGDLDEEDGKWSPQISLGMPVMIPEAYVPDLQVRMQLYRRLGDLTESEEINAFGSELIDRFGPLPEEVQHLLKIVLVKSLCRTANVEKVDAGPKGAVITLRNGNFPNPHALVQLVADPKEHAKVRPDQKLVFSRNWPDANKKNLWGQRESLRNWQNSPLRQADDHSVSSMLSTICKKNRWIEVSVMLLPELRVQKGTKILARRVIAEITYPRASQPGKAMQKMKNKFTQLAAIAAMALTIGAANAQDAAENQKSTRKTIG